MIRASHIARDACVAPAGVAFELRAIFDAHNARFFSGQLPSPDFVVDAYPYEAPAWVEDRRPFRIGFTPQSIARGRRWVSDLLVHECCHSAVRSLRGGSLAQHDGLFAEEAHRVGRLMGQKTRCDHLETWPAHCRPWWFFVDDEPLTGGAP